MELKLKYQYTYFIKPFIIKENKYKDYLLSLLNNKDFNLKIFEKEGNINIYSYFIPDIRDYFFPTFSFDRNYINKLDKIDNKTNAGILSKLHCNIFEYNLNNKMQGKVSKDGIFFNINKIEIICFDTGICFLVMKTDLENSESFSDLINFNYRFKDINTDFGKLRDFTNIKIQTSKFNNMRELSDFIDDITGINTSTIKAENADLYNRRFFVYTYSCIDQEIWNKQEDFNNFKSEFFKYINLLSSNDSMDFNKKEEKINTNNIEEFKFSRFGFTKQSAGLMTSSVDINNYTKLLFSYENEYLYTLIISLYQRIYLKNIENMLKNNLNVKNTVKKFIKFTKEIFNIEITNSNAGTIFYKNWREVFELQEIYNEIKDKYEVIYKESNIDKNNKINRVIIIALVASLVLNIVNFISFIKIM